MDKYQEVLDTTTLEQFIAYQYDKNDTAHRMDHVLRVKERAIQIAKILRMTNDYAFIRKLVFAAILHDCMVWKDRKQHHTNGREYILEHQHVIRAAYTEVKGGVSDTPHEDIYHIADAVAEHRASFRGEYTSGMLGMVLSAADRHDMFTGNESDDTKFQLFDRSYLVFKEQNKLSHPEAVVAAFDHVKDKYGSNGYAFVNNPIFNYLHKEGIARSNAFVDQCVIAEVYPYLSNKYDKGDNND